MRRYFFTGFALLLFAPVAAAQDMPLSQILIDGEGWAKAEGKRGPAAVKITVVPILAGDGAPIYYEARFTSGRSVRMTDLPGVPRPASTNPTPRDAPTAALLTPDGATVYVAGNAQRYVWAFQVGQDGNTAGGGRYCPLRPQAGEVTTRVTALTTDKDGRIYAATPPGVQVFDPTGRLCGVVAAPAVGLMHSLAFEGDRLIVWVGDVKYTRKLKTSGVK